MGFHQVHRYHDISCGHRVVGHESKCRHLHGHNYRIHFTCMADGVDDLDSVGRVIDFGVIKSELCMWVENVWDHHMLIWDQDPVLPVLQAVDPTIVAVPFNPTAENMAKYLVEVVGPATIARFSIVLAEVTIEETMKCSATYAR